jgi:hypothetical protein
MVRYRLVLTPTHEGTFIAVVPDMPRLCATGQTQAEAASHAAEALKERVRRQCARTRSSSRHPSPHSVSRTSRSPMALSPSQSAAPPRHTELSCCIATNRACSWLGSMLWHGGRAWTGRPSMAQEIITAPSAARPVRCPTSRPSFRSPQPLSSSRPLLQQGWAVQRSLLGARRV